MEKQTTGERRVYRARMDASGRVVIPADSKLRQRLKEGETLVLEEDDDGLRIKSLEQAVREAQNYFLSVIPAKVSLVDELLAERREEAARE